MLEQGTVLSERYTILRVLGRGGMGSVYLASMPALGGKEVAIKEMEVLGRPDDQQAALAQFKIEASFLANLEHPNLVSVSDLFTEGSRCYLVMAYVDGETLEQKLTARASVFDWAQVKEWALTLCDVLHYLHTRTPPILFRDLKPANIMVDSSGTLKLIDFGIARAGDVGSKTSTFLKGTRSTGYSPIEQHGESGSTDVRSDVYSLGATMYVLLTGKVPPDALKRLYGHTVKSPSELQAALPPQADAVVLRAMSHLAKNRFQTISEMRDSLFEQPVAPPPPEPSPDLEPPSQPAGVTVIAHSAQPNLSNWLWLVLTLLVAGLIFGYTKWMASPAASQPSALRPSSTAATATPAARATRR